MIENDQNITELAGGQTRRRNAAIEKFNKHRHDRGLQMTAPYYGRHIPPRPEPYYAGWIPMLAEGYEMLCAEVNKISRTLMHVSSTYELDPVACRCSSSSTTPTARCRTTPTFNVKLPDEENR